MAKIEWKCLFGYGFLYWVNDASTDNDLNTIIAESSLADVLVDAGYLQPKEQEFGYAVTVGITISC